MPFFFSSLFSDDHGFSPLHWLAKEGHTKLVEMLLQRGARVNATNMGDDIPLHLAVAHGHLDIVLLVRRMRFKSAISVRHNKIHYNSYRLVFFSC